MLRSRKGIIVSVLTLNGFLFGITGGVSIAGPGLSPFGQDTSSTLRQPKPNTTRL